jgi:hypothetical protein
MEPAKGRALTVVGMSMEPGNMGSEVSFLLRRGPMAFME